MKKFIYLLPAILLGGCFIMNDDEWQEVSAEFNKNHDEAHKCQPGFYGPNCQRCLCGDHGKCNDGNSGDGSCTCDDGWQGITCEQKSTCPAHFTGENCDQCVEGYYGPECNKCLCVRGTCNDGVDGDGSCSCPLGYGGEKCESCATGFTGDSCGTCKDGYYSPECKQCECGEHAECNDTKDGDGSCNCHEGFDQNSDCETCLPNFWGETCTKCDCVHGDCSDGLTGDGSCSCDDGWKNTRCDQPEKCTGGFGGNYCDQCLENYYGSTCQPCDCNGHGNCNDGKSGDGKCECDIGFAGEHCELCADGYFGENCQPCDCNGRGKCHQGKEGDGKCDCNYGYGGNEGHCEDCSEGFYGPNCTQCTCGSGTCHDGLHNNGTCDCPTGFKDNEITCTECAGNYFGENCQKCTCKNGTCDGGRSGKGVCKSNSCFDGYSGTNCDACDSNHFGPKCLPCTCKNGICKSGIDNDGTCVEGSCKDQYMGPNCDTCVEGYYGPLCKPYLYETVTDVYYQKDYTFKITIINDRTWMAENLKLMNSWDYSGYMYEADLNKWLDLGIDAGYGYMGTDKNYCPDGWSVPTEAEFRSMLNYIGATSQEQSRALRAQSWDNGLDAFGMTVLPDGYFYSTCNYIYLPPLLDKYNEDLSKKSENESAFFLLKESRTNCIEDDQWQNYEGQPLCSGKYLQITSNDVTFTEVPAKYVYLRCIKNK